MFLIGDKVVCIDNLNNTLILNINNEYTIEDIQYFGRSNEQRLKLFYKSSYYSAKYFKLNLKEQRARKLFKVIYSKDEEE